MRKLLLIFTLLALPAWGQQATTTVRATATMGVNFSGGAIKATQIVPNGNGTPSYSFFFDAGGNMVFVAPGGTYQFTFCNVLNACYEAQGVLVSNNQDLTTVFTTASSITAGVSAVNGRSGAVTILPGDIPNNAANTSGTAANLSGTPALPNGTTATTQAANDGSTDIATDAFVIANGGTGSQNNPASPIMGFYLGSTCPPANNGQCFNSPANTQEQNACSWTAASATVTCLGEVFNVTASVTSNVATYSGVIPSNWATSDSITVSQFTGGDTFFNQTCTLTGVTTSSVTCALTHANASSTTSGIIINSNKGPFVVGDVGKRIFGYQTCVPSTNLAANNNNNPITLSGALTIQTFLTSTQISMSGNAANTVTQSSNYPQGGCAIYGNPDDTGAAAMDTAMQAVNFCPQAHLTSANYLFTTPHFVGPFPGCTNLGSILPGTNAGNIFYAMGFSLEGRDAGTTVIFMPPGFPESGSCTNGKAKNGCWVIPTEGRWHNFSMSGGGNRVTPNIVNRNIIEIDGPASLDYFNCTNFGGKNTNTLGQNYALGAYLWAQLQQVDISGCGSSGMGTNVSSSITAFRFTVENLEGFRGMDIGVLTDYYTQNPYQFSRYNLTCYDCQIIWENIVDPNGFAPAALVSSNARIKWYRGGITTLSFNPVQSQNGFLGYDCIVTGCLLDVQDASFDLSTSGTGTGYIAINSPSAGTVIAKNSTIKGGASSGSAYTDVAGSKLIDLGGNTFGNVSISGQVFGSLSITGTLQTSGNFAIAPASSATFSAVTGNSLNGQVTATWAGTPSTTETITMTFPTTFLVAPRCTVVDVGGTNPFPTAIDTTNTATTTTTLTIKETFAVAPTVGNTDLFVWNCSN